MKTHLIWVAFAAWILLVASAPAQDEKEAANPLSAIFKTDFFESIEADEMLIDSTGRFECKGTVIFNSDQLKMECDQMTVNQETKIMKATGRPVKIKQGDIRSECGEYTYDLAKKISYLRNDPAIFQKDGDKTVRVSGYMITITQGKDSATSVHIKWNKGAGKKGRSPRSEIVRVDEKPKKKTKEEKAPTAPKKIDAKNLESIKLPVIDGQAR